MLLCMHVHVAVFEQLHRDYDVVVNCSGMRARWLCDDRKMVPVRGQILKVSHAKVHTKKAMYSLDSRRLPRDKREIPPPPPPPNFSNQDYQSQAYTKDLVKMASCI